MVSNSSQIRLAIAGASGRMGKYLVRAALNLDSVMLTTLISRASLSTLSNLVSSNVGGQSGFIHSKVKIKNNLEDVVNDFDVLIDFTQPQSTLDHLNLCYQYGKGIVIGTTGFNQEGKLAIKKASSKIPIVFTANFSIGMNIVLKLLEKTAMAACKYNQTDIEILDLHHRHKADSPSGTAIMMGESIAKAFGRNLSECSVTNQKEATGKKRKSGTIGFMSGRAGNIIGEHTAIFANDSERIEFTHKAASRSVFAKGAVLSASWLEKKEYGLFNMCDVLGLNNL